MSVRVVYHEDPEGWSADSPDVPGYAAVGETLDEVRELVRDGLPFFLDTADVEVDEYFPTVIVSASFDGGMTERAVRTGVIGRVRSSKVTRTAPAAVRQFA